MHPTERIAPTRACRGPDWTCSVGRGWGLGGSSSGGTAQLTLSLRNIGKSAALNIEAHLEGGAEPIGPRAVIDVIQADGKAVVIGIQTSVPIFQSYVTDNTRRIKTTIHYEDALGNRYQFARTERHSPGNLSEISVALHRMVDGEWRRLG